MGLSAKSGINGPYGLILYTTTEPTLVSTLSEELNAYSKRKYDEERWMVKSKLEFDGIFGTFVDVVGDKPVSEITKVDIQ